MITFTDTLLRDTMTEVAAALAETFSARPWPAVRKIRQLPPGSSLPLEQPVDATVIVSARPVDLVVTPELIVTAGEPWMRPGGSICERLITLNVVIYAGRFALEGTWDLLTDLSEHAYRTLEEMPAVTLTSLGRAGKYEVAGVDYLGAVIAFDIYR
jgi:hypothetical protein